MRNFFFTAVLISVSLTAASAFAAPPRGKVDVAKMKKFPGYLSF